MRMFRLWCMALCLVFAGAPFASAHRVNIFAFVDGDAVQVLSLIHICPREVVIIKLEPRREVYTTALAGRIASFQVAEVRPQVGGILQQRLFTEGADVKAGQALYQIDPATYEAALDSAQAALMKAEANVTPARLKAERFRELLAIKAVSYTHLPNNYPG